ncbi:flagellar type III secretion system pore protein FliP [Buchnera aphidicola]|uniref:flagellar type III secretion system pore protein FliP n=1 Tax=Buchnera aphidicola TaxID=9 RepID=UPI0031B6736C
MNFFLKYILYFFISFFPRILYAKNFFSLVDTAKYSQNFWNVSLQTFLIFFLLSFIPAIILLMTSFTRIIIVFGLLRNALGTPYSPPNQILITLSLFLTFFIMSPVFTKIYSQAYVPYFQEKLDFKNSMHNAIKPLHQFMRHQTRKTDLLLFFELAKIKYPKKENNIPLRILLPAYIISELKTAFQIGFSIFLPFLVIDLVVASILMALGMMMVSPSTISLPLKLILFVLSDGWNLLITALSKSFF